MKFRTLFLAIACSLPAVVCADEFKIFELKSGKVYNDVQIVDETETEYILNVPEVEGKTIKVERHFLKTDVKKAIRPTAEELDYKKLQRYFVQEDQANEQSIADYKFQTERFLKKYPDSENKKTIEGQQVKYDEIMKHLDAGDVRLDGKWITKAVQERIAYSLQSKRLLDMMKSRITSKDYRNALNCYDKLLMDFSASEATLEAEKMIMQVSNLYLAQLKEQLATEKSSEATKQQELDVLTKQNKSTERAALQKKYNEAKGQASKLNAEKMQKERDAGIKRWLPVNLSSAPSIEQAIYIVESFVATKKREQADKNKPDNKSSVPSYEGKGDSTIAEFWAAIDAEDLKLAKDKMSSVRSFRVLENIRTPMDGALKVLQDKKMAEEAAARVAREEARKAEAEKRAADRAAERERQKKAREEISRKAKEAAEKRAGGGAAKPDAPAPTPAPAPAPAQ